LYEVITQTRAEILDDHSHRRKASPD
jgi:hypothetical protein